MGAPPDDLLTPTLSADFDVHAFRRPWNPRHLFWSGFLGGPLAGGVLAGLNYRRLNQPRRANVAFALAALAGVLLAVGFVLWLRGRGEEVEARSTGRIALRAVGGFLTMALAAPQNQRFDAYTAAGLAPGKLLGPAVAAIFGLGILQTLLALAFGAALVLMESKG